MPMTLDELRAWREVPRDRFVYGLTDPRTGKVRYVGQTVNMAQRLAWHYSSAGRSQTPKARWIAELRSLGLRPAMVVLEYVPMARYGAFHAEWRWAGLLNCPTKRAY